VSEVLPLLGSVAVVSGASRGLGFETARYLARRGASVAVCGRTADDAQEAAKAIGAEFATECLGSAVDVADPEAGFRFAEQVNSELGPTRFLINNAAILGPVGRLRREILTDWSSTIDVNLKGPGFLIAAFSEQIKAAGSGRVINLSGGGVGGPNPMQRVSAYGASKAGIGFLTELLADEMAAIGATINAIAPGSFPTTFLSGVLTADEAETGPELRLDAASRDGRIDRTTLTPFFNLVDFLLDPASNWLTGRVLSARWDTPDALNSARALDQLTTNMYRLRRIDGDLFEGKQ
jgi:NAD(P)-dependent dehydrogenase (short-subunit alcohol dehydrogenase family)